jgi:hypothetical protein
MTLPGRNMLVREVRVGSCGYKVRHSCSALSAASPSASTWPPWAAPCILAARLSTCPK